MTCSPLGESITEVRNAHAAAVAHRADLLILECSDPDSVRRRFAWHHR
jgi:hypothetical protein